MSPFPLRSGEWVSCTSGGYAHPFEHAANCPCPCPMCIHMFVPVLEHIGLLDTSRVARHLYIVAFDHLAVSTSVPDDDSWTGLHNSMYRRLGDEAGQREANPTATIGWLLDDENFLLDVRVPSDPYPERTTELLTDWADANGITVRRGI